MSNLNGFTFSVPAGAITPGSTAQAGGVWGAMLINPGASEAPTPAPAPVQFNGGFNFLPANHVSGIAPHPAPAKAAINPMTGGLALGALAAAVLLL